MVGYKELIDMSDVDHIALPSANRVRDLAQLSAGMDRASASSMLAIVARSDLAFGLGRMYQTYRELQVKSTKQVGVFRSLDDALAFLGVERGPPDRRGA